ncbi:MAG: hypothetical protein GYB36_08885 [Alphaproteobacteria bacterium]|nr:hypothetical protein [Alphaproteobacteria bacterium]
MRAVFVLILILPVLSGCAHIAELFCRADGQAMAAWTVQIDQAYSENRATEIERQCGAQATDACISQIGPQLELIEMRRVSAQSRLSEQWQEYQSGEAGCRATRRLAAYLIGADEAA